MTKAASGASPYQNDLDYLEHLLEWVECKCRLILTQRALEQPEVDPELGNDDRYHRHGVAQDTRPDRFQQLKQQEPRLRSAITARLKATTEFVPSLESLCTGRGLDRFERTVLLLALAPSFSNRFGELYAAVSRDRIRGGSPSVELAFEFAELPFADRVRYRRYFAPNARLLKNDLITMSYGSRLETAEDLLDSSIEMPTRTFNFLVGDRGLSDEFQQFSSIEEPMATLDQVVLPPEDKRRILSVVERHDLFLHYRQKWGFDEVIRYGKGMLMLFHGKPGTGKTLTAHAIAHHLGKRVLNVDIPTLVDNREADRFLPGLFREARLQNALLFFDECETIFASRRLGNMLMTLLLTELERFEGIAVLATNLPETLDEALDRRILVKVHFQEPDRNARLEIWRRHLPPQAPLAPDVDLPALAERFDMAGGYIKNAVLMAVADAVHSDGDNPVIRMEHLHRAARTQLIRPVEDRSSLRQPLATLADVILPAEIRNQLEELVAAARNRRTVLDRWGIGRHLSRGKGISALFHGEPGTGKTLAAEAVAAELGRPIRVASIPSLVSKWVGDTEKNLRGLFDEVKSSEAVLFLDEADSLLMERGEGRASRHDDSAVNTFLQLIEEHDGVVLLATNLANRLDRALARRLTYMLRFPAPDATARTAIWRKHIPDTVPTQGDLDLEALATSYALSGGQIRNAVFKAAFRAARIEQLISQEVLCHAAAEELGATADVRGVARTIGFTN